MNARARLREIVEELRTVMTGRQRWADSLLPPLVFLIVHLASSLWPAVWSSVGTAVVLFGVRLRRRQSVRFALGGLGGVLMAGTTAAILRSSQAFYWPGLISGTVTALACLASVLVRRPLVAWTSHLARRWPLDWYWHPRVRPAYSEVTLAWFAFYLGRFGLQFALLQTGEVTSLSVVRLVTGWPAIVLLLAASYLYGLWRLRRLGGPSVEEFEEKAPEPWKGQRRGF